MIRRPLLLFACSLLITLTALPASAQYLQQGPKLTGSGAFGVNPKQGGSVALSADGNTAAVGFDQWETGGVLIYVRTNGAWVQQGPLLVGTGLSAFCAFGRSVALSADGNTLIVGAPFDGNNLLGATLVFTRSGGVWTQQGPKLVGTGAVVTPYCEQGTSVALSADGNTALVGAALDNSSAGSTWVFTRSGGVWSQQGSKLTGAVTGTSSVALSGDGNTALIGASSDSSNFGAAVVYTRSAGTWTQQGSKLVGTGSAGYAWQGRSVALSTDGNTALVGGVEDDLTRGAVWVFTRSGNVWSQQGPKLVGSGAVRPSKQGSGLSLSPDGSFAVIGGSEDDGLTGAVWLFQRKAGVWQQLGTKRVPSDGAGQMRFGISAAMAADGKTLLFGGSLDNGYTGAAWVFVDALAPFPGNAQLVQQGGKLFGSGAVGGAAQGDVVAISKDGRTAAVGGIHDNGNRGAVWVYVRSGNTWAPQGAKLVGTGGLAASLQGVSLSLSRDGNTLAVGSGAGDGAWIYARGGSAWIQVAHVSGIGAVGSSAQGSAVALSDDGNTLLLGGQHDDGLKGAVWVFTRVAGVWTQQGAKLVPNDGVGTPFFGLSAALSPDGNSAIIGGPGDANNRGAAWIFKRSGVTWSQQGVKIPGGFELALAGRSVAISEDGRTALLGAFYDAARVFVRTGASWVAQGPTLSGTGASVLKSEAVALSADGDMALVGEGDVGAVWAFTRRNGVWRQLGSEAVASDAVGGGTSGMGSGVALSADGETAIFGGGGDNGGAGAAWIFVNPLGADCQFASRVLDYSSQYTATGDEWHAVRALGAPTVYPFYRDDAEAWASAGPDDQPEYLDLEYAHGARINFVNVFETYAPGAIDTISVRNPYSGEFENVWTGTAAAADARSRIFTATFPVTRFPVSEVRVHLDSPAVPDWNEIDAVDIGYRDLTTASQWASGVVAKSSEFSPEAWGATQALGAPNLYPLYADDPRAWASATPDDQQEFLDLSYTSPQTISFVSVYETYTPGALKQVSVKNPSTGDFEVVWTGAAEAAAPVARIRTVSFPETRFAVSEVKLEFDMPAVPDWNEVDAVGIGSCSCLAVPLGVPGPSAQSRDVLEVARPTPFSASTGIAFTLSRPGHVRVEVFSVTGQRVATVMDGNMSLGRHEARWDGRDTQGRSAASGVYYVRISSPMLTGTRKVVKIQ